MIRVGLLAATGFALLEASKAFVASRLRGIPIPLSQLLIQNAPWWYVWALLAPFVIWIARRLPLTDRSRLPRNLGLHFLAAVTISSVHLWITGPIFFFTAHMPALPVRNWASFRVMITLWHGEYLMSNVMTYAMIAGVTYAVEYFRRYSQSRISALELETRASRLQRGITEARLDSLRKELNPHFLFNSLNAVSGLVRRGENSNAVVMLARLGDLLRMTLDRRLPLEISLHEELALLDHYIEIERVRFGQRLTVHITVPDGLRDAMVPTLCLQPLVENAMRHGFSNRPGPGSVTVSAAARANVLRLTVEDTGPGFSTAALNGAVGLGVSNTRARLQQLHDDQAGLELTNVPGAGARVTMWMPLRFSATIPESVADSELALSRP